MVVLKALLGLLIGAVIGFIGGFILFLVLWIVVGIATWNSKTGENVGNIVAVLFWLASALIGFATPLVRAAREDHVNFIEGLPRIAGFVFAASVAGILIYLVKCYPVVMSVGGIYSGIILGALAGAGVGALVPQLTRSCRARSETGPLSCLDCLSDTARLRVKYQGIREITEDITEGREEAWVRRAVPVALPCALLVVGVALTYREYTSLHPSANVNPSTNTIVQPVLPGKDNQSRTASRDTVLQDVRKFLSKGSVFRGTYFSRWAYQHRNPNLRFQVTIAGDLTIKNSDNASQPLNQKFEVPAHFKWLGDTETLSNSSWGGDVKEHDGMFLGDVSIDNVAGTNPGWRVTMKYCVRDYGHGGYWDGREDGSTWNGAQFVGNGRSAIALRKP